MDNFATKKAILDKIKEYDKIIIGRHFRPDGDAVGSTMGLARIIRASFPEKTVNVVNEDFSDYVSFIGDETQAFEDSYYEDALFIAIDTSTTARFSNKKFGLCKELIKIDHHIEDEHYGDISWVEDFRASASEMIVDFYITFKDELTMTKEAATALFTGIATDSGRFRFDSVSGDTMRLSGALIDMGIDTEWIYSNLYLEPFENFKFQSFIYSIMHMTENGVLYIHVTREMQKEWNVSYEEASNSVSLMNSVKGSPIWIAFIDDPFGPDIRVRLRSRFFPVNEIASKYSGGGHANACGATVHNEEELNALISDADAYLKEMKEKNTNWM